MRATAMDEAEIKERFVRAIDSAVTRHRVLLGYANEFKLPDLAAGAAKAIVASTPPGPDRNAAIARGETEFARLIAAMAEAARTLPGNPPSMLTERTLVVALEQLSPNPPYW